MKFFKRLTSQTTTPIVPTVYVNFGDTLQASVDYFSSTDDITSRHILNKERVILNRYALGELSCSTEELDVKLNHEVITESATHKYGVGDSDLAVSGASWFPRLRQSRGHSVIGGDGGDSCDAVSRTSSEGVSKTLSRTESLIVQPP